MTSHASVNRLRFSYVSSAVLGLGMFGISLAAGIYNSYVLLVTRHYIPSAAVIGLIVSVRTRMGVVLNMYYSARSDRTDTPGRSVAPLYSDWNAYHHLVLFMLCPWQIGKVSSTVGITLSQRLRLSEHPAVYA